MRAGLFLGGGRLAGRMMADKIGRGIKNQTQTRRPQEEPQPRRGLFGGARSMLGNVGGFLQNETGGVSNLDRIGLAAAMMRDDPSFALAAQQGIDRQQSAYQQRQQEMQEAQGQRNTQEKQAEQERQRLDGQARALGMDPREFSMLPAEVQSELLARQYTPEAQEPNLRAFGGNMYDFSDPQNPRMVMQGQEPRRDIETVVIDGRLVNRRTGEMIADYSDPNETGPDLTEQQAKFGMLTDIARNSNRILDEVEFGGDGKPGTDDDFEFNRGSATVASMQNSEVPVVGGLIRGAGEMFEAPDTRRAYDAYMGLTEAYLRATTGAQAPQAEIDRAMSQIVPRPGDSQSVRSDKQRRRREWQSAIERAAGPGAREQNEVIEIDF